MYSIVSVNTRISVTRDIFVLISFFCFIDFRNKNADNTPTVRNMDDVVWVIAKLWSRFNSSGTVQNADSKKLAM